MQKVYNLLSKANNFLDQFFILNRIISDQLLSLGYNVVFETSFELI